ncbi:MAG: methyltransferase domain-containing protein [Hyphomicrobiales bacterium]|nr:methyltransferase domain-containing protein [Hyphomicrobiales bacterium]
MAKSLVQAQFGANAANYSTSSVHAKGASLGRLIELVKPQSSWRVLDVATGGGHVAMAFAPHVREVVASDLTPQMLEETRRNAAAKGLGNIATAEADAEEMPFEDASFDLVTCRIAPHHFPDIAVFVGEVRRVLRPGGVFALVDNVAPDAATTPGHSRAELRDADLTYNAFEKIRDPSHGRALTTGEWLEIVADTGLLVQHSEHQAKAMNFADWCRNMSVPEDTVPRLAAMLREASPALRAFLKPADNDGALTFELAELILIAKKD